MRHRLLFALPLLCAFTSASASEDAASAPDADPCAEIRRAIEKRQDYLRRLAAERDAFAWVENAEDAQALRQLMSLQRCAEHPDDEDCIPPPIEVRLEDLEIPRHVVERRPEELEATGKDPDEAPHDPKILDLLRRLEACERRVEDDPQPLLRPRPAYRPGGRASPPTTEEADAKPASETP
ncbi:MAG TPA: hypothetical protein VKY51_01840 [Fredinandcohnia sp.]|nr:hypothetical protein [Fredinandcohnia sp.]